MRQLIVALVVAWSCAAHADVPAGIAQRVVRFIFAGCDYLTAHSPEPHKPGTPDKKLATHFGRVTGSRMDGIRVRYDLKTSAFDGWDVSYWARGIDIKIPSTVTITIGDLARFLGPDDSLDVDKAVSATSSSAKIQLEEREFKTQRDDYCYVTVQADADKTKGPGRRVFSLRFVD